MRSNTFMASTSAIPDIYYAIFGLYEPLLCIIGLVGTFIDPKSSHDQQAPWPIDAPAPEILPRASLVTVLQLATVCSILGIVNFFVLSAARTNLASHPRSQEKIVKALLTPLLLGDVTHMYVTLWALGEQRWDVMNWSPLLWATVLLGSSLLIPRIAWHMGIGRFVESRDAVPAIPKT